jgi:hypothetical protein
LLATINLNNVACCEVQIENPSADCIPNTNDGILEFGVTGGLPTESYYVSVIDQETNTVVEFDNNFLGGTYTSGVLPAGNYLVTAVDNNYIVANVGRNIGTPCRAEQFMNLDCNFECGLDSALVTITPDYQKHCDGSAAILPSPGMIALDIANNHGFAIDVIIYYKYVATPSTPCGVPPFPGTGYTVGGTISGLLGGTTDCREITAHPIGQETCVYVKFIRSDHACLDEAYTGPTKTQS